MDLAGKEYFTKIDNYHIITQLPLCEKEDKKNNHSDQMKSCMRMKEK